MRLKELSRKRGKMVITVRDVLKLPILNVAKVVTGQDELAGQKVEWITATEGPAENFVRQDEMILTTGVACENDKELLQFIKDIDRFNAAAIAIAVGEHFQQIPRNVIDYAMKKGMILIELPLSLRFTEIQREAMALLTNREQENAQQVQDRLINFVLQGKQLIDLMNYVEDDLKCSIIFTNYEKRTISASVENPEKIVERWNELASSQNIYTEHMSSFSIEVVDYEDGYLLKKQVASNVDHIGENYFLCLVRKRMNLNVELLQTIDSLAAAAAVWLSREAAVLKTELTLNNQFVWELANTKDAVYDEKSETRAHLCGFKIDLPYVCIVGYSEEFSVSEFNETNNQQGQDKPIVFEIERKIRHIAQTLNKQFAFAIDGHYLIVFLEADHLKEPAIHQFIDKLNEALHQINRRVMFSWGIGQHEKGIKAFYESYEKAYSALEAILSQQRYGERYSFEETILNRLLLYLTNHEEVVDIVEEMMQPLLEYRHESGIDLIKTFSVYDASQRNVSSAARALNLHRQSLLYRLDKIEKLTNLAVDNPDDAFVLNLTIRIWETKVISREDSPA